MSVAHRLGRVLEKLTRQSGRLPEAPEYGSWLLGKSTESPARRRIRIQVIPTVFILAANILGVGAALMLVTVAFPVPSIFSDAPAWITWVVCPAYIVLALMIGTFWITRQTVNDLRWAIEERTPKREDQLDTFLARIRQCCLASCKPPVT
jgi:adenylate cyclase